MTSPEPRVLGGKYRLVRQLDQGGMGSVWYAEHLVLAAPVAVKLLELEPDAGGAAVARFLREAQTAASLRSPHVVQIFDYGVDDRTPYIVMELLVGESLAQRLKRVGRLSPAEADAVITQVARAIGRAHDAGIVHRDLKPANVFVVKDTDLELIKVLDFGIAKAPASVTAHTQSGTFLGTPAYASPEQIQGVRALDRRSDIWSLGVIAFECLLGLRPFTGDTFGAIVVAVCSKPMPVPSTCGAVPAGFDDWFAKACARDPEQRFASAREAAETLSRVCAAPLTFDAGATQASAAALAHDRTVPDPPESSGTVGAAAEVNALASTRNAAEPPSSAGNEADATHRAASMSSARSLPARPVSGRAWVVAALALVALAIALRSSFGGSSAESIGSGAAREPGPPAETTRALSPPIPSAQPTVRVVDAGSPPTSEQTDVTPATKQPPAKATHTHQTAAKTHAATARPAKSRRPISSARKPAPKPSPAPPGPSGALKEPDDTEVDLGL